MKTLMQLLRKLKRSSNATLLGLTGLVIGLTCVMYIFFWINNELSYNKIHKNLDRIFMVNAYLDGGKERQEFGGCPPAVAPAIKEEYPEIKATARYIPGYEKSLVSHKDKKSMTTVALADFSLFDIFTLPFEKGNRGNEGVINRIVISSTTANTFFGSENPVGKVIRYKNMSDFIVVGVIEDIPSNSSIKFDAVIPIQNLKLVWGGDENILNTWYNNGFRTYGLLTSPSAFGKVAYTITKRIQKELPESTNYLTASLFKDYYLYKYNKIRNVKIFGLIGLMVLIASILNFINLMTAKMNKQAKITGVQKSLGASRFTVIKNIYTEVAFVCLIAFVLAFSVAYAGLPLFSSIIEKKIAYTTLIAPQPILALVALYIITVLLAGAYPAAYLSGFSPANTLKPSLVSVKNNGFFRNTLVVSIFIISIILLSSTLVIRKQISLLQNTDVGFNKEQLLYINLKGELSKKAQVVKNEAAKMPGIISSSVTSELPSFHGSNGEGWSWEGKDVNFKPLITFWITDADMAKTLEAKMIEGTYFSDDKPGVVINKAFAKIIGWSSFAGRSLRNGNDEIKITGVVENMIFNDLSKPAEPMLIFPIRTQYNNFLISRIDPKKHKEILAQFESLCKKIEPDQPFQFGFVDDSFAELVQSEKNLAKLVGMFSIFALLVLCFGLLGVILFLAEQKTKEIGVRKCMGEKVSSLIIRFVKPFVISGIIASVVAIPITWYVMQKWLQNYANRIHLNIWIFTIALLFILLLAILTVSWQSWRAATRNPVEALRYE